MAVPKPIAAGGNKYTFLITYNFQAMSTKANSEIHVHQPTLESYEDDALFFISYAQVRIKCFMRYSILKTFEVIRSIALFRYRRNVQSQQVNISYLRIWFILSSPSVKGKRFRKNSTVLKKEFRYY